ncbi:MAG: hypothetical protein WDM70_03245 [Nitrosomonadales bacterium]
MILVNHINKGSLGSALNSRDRQKDRVVAGFYAQAGIDELIGK